MKNKIGLLVSLSAVLLLVGAGCATKQPEAPDGGAQSDEVKNSRVMDSGATDENATDGDEAMTPDNGADAPPQLEVKSGTEVKTETGASAGKTPLTMAEVAKHNSQSDCYIIVSDSVYDVTKFIPNHPGGPQRIIPLCGKDATSAFTGQHGGQPQPEAALASMKIGALQK